MQFIPDAASTNDFIDSLPRKKEWSLGSMRLLVEKLGIRPQQFKAVHVTGTNGKGSVAAFVSSVLLNAGYKVGTYTSPHLLAAAERISVNGSKISARQFDELAREVAAVVEKIPEAKKPSFFEAITAMALLHFQREGVDFVVAEVGMGGRLDSTNLLRPLVAVITNVSLEHTQILGKTVPAIAREKAGIIKPGCVVVTAAEGKALEEIRKMAKEKKAGLFVVGKKDLKKIFCTQEETCFQFEGRKYCTKLLGQHQALNAALAVKAIDLLREKGIEVSRQEVREGLRKTVWPGRMQLVSKNPLVVLDGAHNPAAARSLAHAVKTIWPGKKIVLVVGILSDKDAGGVLEAFSKTEVSKLVATQPASARALAAEKLAEKAGKQFGKRKTFVVPKVADALDYAKKNCGKNELVLVTGSFYTVGEALSHLRLNGK